MQTYTFTSAELALLTHSIAREALPLDNAALADLAIDQQQLTNAQQRLRDRGLLVDGPAEGLTVIEPVAAVLSTTLFPEYVAVLRTSLRDQAQRQTIFSFARDRIVRNVADAQGQHVFSAFDSLQEALDEIISASGVSASLTRRTTVVMQPLETLTGSMDALAMLMIVRQPAQPEPDVRNLAWLLARGALWLVDAEQGRTQSARPIDRHLLARRLAHALRSTGVSGAATD